MPRVRGNTDQDTGRQLSPEEVAQLRENIKQHNAEIAQTSEFGTSNLSPMTDLTAEGEIYKPATLAGDLGFGVESAQGTMNFRDYPGSDTARKEKAINPEQYAKNMQLADIQSGLYTLNLPSDYAQQQRQLATQMGMRQAPELDLRNYNQDRAAMVQALDYQNANRDQFISAGYEGQKALGTAAQYAAKNAARGTNLSQMADQNRSAQEIAGRVGAQAANEENTTRNRLIQGAAQARAQDQQVVKAWQNAQLTQRSMNDAMVKFYLTQGMDFEQAQAQAKLEAAKLYSSRKGLGEQAQSSALQTVAQVAGAIFGLGG